MHQPDYPTPKCVRPPPGFLYCTSKHGACPSCQHYYGWCAGRLARDVDDGRSRLAVAGARPFVDTLRYSPDNLPGSWTRSVLRLWDESGYAGGWARIKDTDLEWHKRVLRQLGLTTAHVAAGKLAPLP